jgi:hypothetical protein
MHCVECPVIDAGVAGASAQRTYQRRHDTRESQVKGKWGGRLGGFVLAVTDEPQSIRAWETGARGEVRLAKALEGIVGVRVLHDRSVRRTKGNIDHIVIAPAGIFVVDAKRYEGQIHIRSRGWFFKPDYRLYVGRHDRSRLAEGLTWQVQAVHAALQSARVEPMPTVTPVICFVDGEWPLLSPPDSYAGVRLESERSIVKLITASQQLDDAAIDSLFRALARALPSK